MLTLQLVQWQMQTAVDLAHVLPHHQMPVQSNPVPRFAAVSNLPGGVPPTGAYQRPERVNL